MAMNTPYLGTPSGDSTVFSDISMSGTLQAGTIESRSAISTGAVTATTGTFTGAVAGTTGTFSSTLSAAGATKTAWIGCAGVTSSSVITCNTVAPLSILTNAADTDMTIGHLRLVFLASGLSLCYSSGATLYVVNSAQSESQPTS